MSAPDDAPVPPEQGGGSDEGLPDESAWEQESPVWSAWVGFWPHAEAPTREEVGRALASWVGRELEVHVPESDEGEESALWALVATIPGVTSPVALWAERAIEPGPGQLPDPGMARCRWVVHMEAVLEPAEAHLEYFHLTCMLAGALPDLAGILDVSSGRRWPREEIEEQFLAQDAGPNDEFLWTITAVAASEDDDAPMMLFTSGLSRCGLPEVEILEVPSRHSQAAAVLISHVASLLLEAPPPAPGAPIEIGPDLSVALVPWQECARFIADDVPGSRAFRELAGAQGDESLSAARAVVCAPEPRGAFRPVWAWPKDVIDRMEAGRAVLYTSEHSAAATERRAQRAWPAFATAYASIRRTDSPQVHALAGTAFHVQAAVGGADDHDRREQGWFVVDRFDHDTVEATLSEEPVTARGLHAGERTMIRRADVTDWRVVLGDDTFGPDRGDALLAAVDRLRGIA